MKTCWECGEALQVIRDEPYHYVESGLDNVYLYGIVQYKCSKCGEESPEIPNIEELHLVIGREIVCRRQPLDAKEIVYLRKELGLKSKEMADLLSVTAQAYSRWENAKEKISPVYDNQIRLIYVLNADYRMGKVLHGGIQFIQNIAVRDKKVHGTSDRKIKISVSEWMTQPAESPFFCEESCVGY